MYGYVLVYIVICVYDYGYVYICMYVYEYVWTCLEVVLVSSTKSGIYADALQGPVSEEGLAKVLEHVCGGSSPLCPGVEEDTVAEGLAAHCVDAAVAAMLPEGLPVAIHSLCATPPPGPATKEPGVLGCHSGPVLRVDEDWPSAHQLPWLGRVRH